MAVCDRCDRALSPGEGYAVWSEARSALTTDSRIQWGIAPTGRALTGETGGMLLCERCADGLFTERVWDEASVEPITIENDRDIAAAKRAQLFANNYAVALRAQRAGLSALAAREEARETARLWWTDNAEAVRRLKGLGSLASQRPSGWRLGILDRMLGKRSSSSKTPARSDVPLSPAAWAAATPRLLRDLEDLRATCQRDWRMLIKNTGAPTQGRDHLIIDSLLLAFQTTCVGVSADQNQMTDDPAVGQVFSARALKGLSPSQLEEARWMLEDAGKSPLEQYAHLVVRTWQLVTGLAVSNDEPLDSDRIIWPGYLLAAKLEAGTRLAVLARLGVVDRFPEEAAWCRSVRDAISFGEVAGMPRPGSSSGRSQS